MRRKINFSIGAVVILFIALLIVEYLRLNGMFQVELKQIKVQAEILLDNQLAKELKHSMEERYDLLERNGLLEEEDMETWGGLKEDTTITIYKIYPAVDLILCLIVR